MQAVFRLSSKSHWDIPIRIDGETVHFLTSHPTPPVFDDPPQFPAGVDFNGRRNFDEIRFFADYITGGSTARYIYDDKGKKGGLKRGERFVIAGDQNSDPLDGDSIPGSIQLLLNHPLVNTSVTPSSPGGPQQSALQGLANTTAREQPGLRHRRLLRRRAGELFDGPGNLRADYVLPRKNMPIRGSAVFWPLNNDPLFPLVGIFNPALLPVGFPSSDHRLVWVDVSLDAATTTTTMTTMTTTTIS